MGLENFFSRAIERFGNCNSKTKTEGFNGNVYSTGDAFISTLMELISMIIVLIVVSLVGAYLWNNSAFVLFKGVNKSNWVNILAFTILLKMIL